MGNTKRFRLGPFVAIFTIAVLLYTAPLAAQNVTLSRSTPQEVGMSAAILEGGVGLYRVDGAVGLKADPAGRDRLADRAFAASAARRICPP